MNLKPAGLHKCFRSTTATEKDPDSKINKIGGIASEETVKVKAWSCENRLNKYCVLVVC